MQVSFQVEDHHMKSLNCIWKIFLSLSHFLETSNFNKVFGVVMICILVTVAVSILIVVGVVIFASRMCKTHHLSQQNMTRTKVASKQDETDLTFHHNNQRKGNQRQKGCCRDSTMIPNEAYNFNFFFFGALLDSPVADYEVAVESASKADNAHPIYQKPKDDNRYQWCERSLLSTFGWIMLCMQALNRFTKIIRVYTMRLLMTLQILFLLLFVLIWPTKITFNNFIKVVVQFLCTLQVECMLLKPYSIPRLLHDNEILSSHTFYIYLAITKVRDYVIIRWNSSMHADSFEVRWKFMNFWRCLCIWYSLAKTWLVCSVVNLIVTTWKLKFSKCWGVDIGKGGWINMVCLFKYTWLWTSTHWTCKTLQR